MEEVDLQMDYCEDCKRDHPVACVECCQVDSEAPLMLCLTHAKQRGLDPTKNEYTLPI